VVANLANVVAVFKLKDGLSHCDWTAVWGLTPRSRAPYGGTAAGEPRTGAGELWVGGVG
jgi:hypothetical protein